MDPQQAATALSGLITFQYLDCASVVLWIYDYFLTLPIEIQFIWSYPRSLIAILFFVIRYPPIFDSVVILGRTFSDPSARSYKALYTAQVYFYVAGLVFSNLVLLLRTAALWNRCRKITIGLALSLSSVAAIAVYFVTRYLAGITFELSPFPKIAPGFFVEDNRNNLYIPYACLVMFETVVLILTLLKATGQKEVSSLHRTVYRDSLLFYFYFFGISVANVTMLAAGPAELRPVLTALHRVLHSVFSGRLILNINEAAAESHIEETISSGLFSEEISAQYPTLDVGTQSSQRHGLS